MKKLTQEYVEDYCLEQGYRVMSPYINVKTKIKLQNIKTSVIGWMRFNAFQQGQRFDNPNHSPKKLTYQEYIQPFANEGYTVLIDEEEYRDINSHTKIKVLCPSGHDWEVSRANFIRNYRCVMCGQKISGMSHGERLIYSILSGNGIDFEREVSIYINRGLHRFDFYLEINNKKYFIEYDGIQHYKQRYNYFGSLIEQQRKDRIKDQYALDNNIQMVRIPYTENKVNKVVRMMNDKMGLDLHEVKVDVPKKQEILDYYLNHSRDETVDRFGISIATICRYTQDIWDMSKEKYLIKIGKK